MEPSIAGFFTFRVFIDKYVGAYSVVVDAGYHDLIEVAFSIDSDVG